MPIPVPPPWVALAFMFTFATSIQDLFSLSSLAASAVISADADSGCNLCHGLIGLVLKISDLDQRADVECSKMCFGIPRCVRTCDKIVTAMATSESYPCVAAGLCGVADADSNVTCRFDWHRMGCMPPSACERKFPFRCQVNDGILSWKRLSSRLTTHAGLVAHALANPPRCGDEGAGPYCVNAARGLGRFCEAASWILPFVWGTICSIHAVETPGGDDDRQWLTFWIIFFLFTALERCTDLLISWVPRYYEIKLLILCWLMFREGGSRPPPRTPPIPHM